MIYTSIFTWATVASVALAASVGGALINQVGAGRVPAPTALPAGPGLASTPSQPAPTAQASPDSPAPQAPPPSDHPAIRQAMAAVEAMDARNEKERDEKVSALIQLGRAQTDQGERDAARETLREALGIVVVQPPGRQTWSLVSIGSAQVRNGDRAEGQRTFDRLPEVFRSLYEGILINPYWSAIRAQQRSVGWDASQALIAAYHDYVFTNKEIDKYQWGPVERARSIALAGRFAEAWERVRQSPDLERPNQPGLRSEAAVAIANALLPDDSPSLIIATLAEARRAVLDLPELEGPESLWKFNSLIRLMDIASQLGRFDEAEELGSHFPPAGRDHLAGTKTFNKAACYDLLAEEENSAGQVDRAMKSARQALAWVRDTADPDTRSYPTTRAIAAMVAAGGDEEAFRAYEATPPGLLMPQPTWDIIVALRKQGKMAVARRWTEVELARNRQVLRQVQEPKPQPLADPQEEARRQRLTPSEATLNRWIAQAEALLGDPARAIQVIEGQPADVRPLILQDLAIDLAQRGHVAEALEMAGRAASPQARRTIEIAVATNLPVPTQPPATQSPRSDAAR